MFLVEWKGIWGGREGGGGWRAEVCSCFGALGWRKVEAGRGLGRMYSCHMGGYNSCGQNALQDGIPAIGGRLQSGVFRTKAALGAHSDSGSQSINNK